jgi:hypothetical protein
MVKRKRHKDKQSNDQKKKTKRQTMQWSKEKNIKTNNAMVKRKRQNDKQCNGQNKKT